MEGSAADGLMVHAGGNATALAGRPGGTVVIRERRKAVLAGQLRDEGAIGEPVGEKNGIEGYQRGGEKAHVFPFGRGGRGAVVKAHPERRPACLVHHLLGLPVDTAGASPNAL